MTEEKKATNVTIIDKKTGESKTGTEFIEFKMEGLGKYPANMRVFANKPDYAEFQKLKKGDVCSEITYQVTEAGFKNFQHYVLETNKAVKKVAAEVHIENKTGAKEVYIIRQNALTQANNFLANVALKQQEMPRGDKIPDEEKPIYTLTDLFRYAERIESWVLREGDVADGVSEEEVE